MELSSFQHFLIEKHTDRKLFIFPSHTMHTAPPTNEKKQQQPSSGPLISDL